MLILASASPRRAELLTQAGVAFEVHAADIDESLLPAEMPAAYVRRLALEKARAIHTLHPEAIVLGADTTVVQDQEILNKPTGPGDAVRMLRLLAGRQHQVYTGIAVVTPVSEQQDLQRTNVFMTHILESELRAYIESGDSRDKAGAYGIQGYAARWVWRIEGDFFNVMGLPIAATLRLLRSAALGTGTVFP